MRRKNLASLAVTIVGALSLAAGASGASTARAQGGAAPADARQADRTAITALLKSLADAFHGRDARALASLWTTEGHYQNSSGIEAAGRATLETAFGRFFAKNPDLSAQLTIASLEFLGADVAQVEGTAEVHRGPASSTPPANFSGVVVREGGQWLLAEFREETNDELSVEDLSWLIGKWTSGSDQAAQVQTTYAWDDNHRFIHVTFTRVEGESRLSGTQIIGLDPATGALHTWTFEADGGIGHAEWERDGDHWVLTASATLADGSTLRETNVLRRIQDGVFTWQSIDRSVDDEPLEDLPPVKVTRIQAAP